MSMCVEFTVYGEPRGKGRPRFSKVNGRTITRTPDETVLYENLVRTEYRQQCRARKFDDHAALSVYIRAYFPIPASVSKKRRRLMEEGKILPTKRPDIDNLAKIVMDSINGIAYRDDAQVAVCSIAKLYGEQPRVWVQIIEIDPEAEG